MGEVINFENSNAIEALKEQLKEALTKHGSAFQAVSTMTMHVDVWRKTARAVGRELGRSVQTLVAGDDAHAILKDWPRDDEEKKAHWDAMRAASDAMALPSRFLRPVD